MGLEKQTLNTNARTKQKSNLGRVDVSKLNIRIPQIRIYGFPDEKRLC